MIIRQRILLILFWLGALSSWVPSQAGEAQPNSSELERACVAALKKVVEYRVCDLCHDNTYLLLQEMQAQGVDLRAVEVLYLSGEIELASYIRAHHARDKDGVLWNYHVVARAQGQIYDLDYSWNEPAQNFLSYVVPVNERTWLEEQFRDSSWRIVKPIVEYPYTRVFESRGFVRIIRGDYFFKNHGSAWHYRGLDLVSPDEPYGKRRDLLKAATGPYGFRHWLSHAASADVKILSWDEYVRQVKKAPPTP